MKRTLRVTLGLLLALVLPVLYVVLLKPTLIFNNVESAIEQKLQNSIGPAADYRVKINTPLRSLARGDMGDISITGRQVRLHNGMVAERLNISLSDVKADAMAGGITSIGDDTFSATIDQADLDRFVEAKFPDVPDLTIEILDGKLAVSTRKKVLFIKSRVRVDATIEIEDGNKLMLRLHNMRASKLKIPGVFRGKFEGKINPILDSSSSGLRTEFKNVVLKEGKIHIYGRIDPEDLTAMQRASAR